MAKRAQKKLKLHNTRLSFFNGFVPSAMDEKDTPTYNCHFLLPKDDPQVKTIKKTLVEVAEQKWPGKGKQMAKQLLDSGKTCLRDGDEKVDSEGNVVDGYEGHYYISARSKVRPRIVDRDPNVELSQEDGKPYSGCYGNPVVSIWAQANQFGKRLNAQWQGVQFMADGEAFGGGGRASPDDFDAIEGDEFEDDDELETEEDGSDLI